MIVADGITLQENGDSGSGGGGGGNANPISVLPRPSTPVGPLTNSGVALGGTDVGYIPPPSVTKFLRGGVSFVSSTFGTNQGPTGGTYNPSNGGIAQTGTGIQNETDTAAQNPPYNPNTPPIQQAIPTNPDDTAAALGALGNIFQSAFASGQPAAVTIGGGGGGGSLPTSTVDTSNPNATTDTTQPATTSSGTGATTWILLALTAVGVYFAWRQLHKKKEKAA